MHVYFITRGIKHSVDRFINELSAKYLPFKMQGKDAMLQTSVRPIQLWEVVFPKEHKDIMLTTLFPDGEICQHKRHKKFLALIRRALGKDVKPIGEWDKTKGAMPLYRAHTEFAAIGIKEDRDLDDGTEAI